jgi:hypothetical protein
MKNQNIFVRMFDDRLVIESPGGFPPFVSPENIYEYSHPRNPHLMSAMFFLDFVKAANEGTRRMRDSMSRLKLPHPEFKESDVGFNTFVRVTLRNNVKQRRVWVVADVSNVVGEEIARQLSEHERMIVNRLADHARINVSEVQRLTGRDWHSAKVMLQKNGHKRHSGLASPQGNRSGFNCPLHAKKTDARSWESREAMKMPKSKVTNAKPIPHIPLPFKEVMADVLKVKPPEKSRKGKSSRNASPSRGESAKASRR